MGNISGAANGPLMAIVAERADCSFVLADPPNRPDKSVEYVFVEGDVVSFSDNIDEATSFELRYNSYYECNTGFRNSADR